MSVNIKNIEAFQGEAITIKTKEETIVIEKVPALATLKLYKEDGLIQSLLSLSHFQNQDLSEATKLIMEIFERYYEAIIDIIALATRRSKDFIETNLGYNEILQTLMAILQVTTEESLELVKKNSREGKT